MAKEKTTIPCCIDCGLPVVWTFAFHGYEYYCLMCGKSTGMLGGKDSQESIPELKAQQFVIERLWKVLKKDFVGDGGYTRSNCKKCKSGDEKSKYHNWHLTPTEIERDKFIRVILEKLSK